MNSLMSSKERSFVIGHFILKSCLFDRLFACWLQSCELLHLRGVLNFFLCFWSELVTDEVVLNGTIRLDSKIRSKNVHFHDSFWREQTLAATKLFFVAFVTDFFVTVSSIGPYVFFRPYHFHAYGPHTGLFLLWFSTEVARGAVPVI